MLNKTRKYAVMKYKTLDELVSDLKGYIWTGCTGFELAGLVLLNDSTEEDSVQKFCVLRRISANEYGLIELEELASLTLDWMHHNALKDAIEYLAEYTTGRILRITLEDPVSHKCHLCE